MDYRLVNEVIFTDHYGKTYISGVYRFTDYSDFQRLVNDDLLLYSVDMNIPHIFPHTDALAVRVFKELPIQEMTNLKFYSTVKELCDSEDLHANDDTSLFGTLEGVQKQISEMDKIPGYIHILVKRPPVDDTDAGLTMKKVIVNEQGFWV